MDRGGDCLSRGDLKQIPIHIDCSKCGHNCRILESCVIMRGGAFVGISLGFVCMHCGHEGEWYATVENIVNEVAKLDMVSGTESAGSETIQ